MASERILLVEDSTELRELLTRNLEHNGYTVTTANDGQDGLIKATSLSFDLVILDAMLPKMSGFDVCTEIRKHGVKAPVLILSARSEDVDKVVGLDAGADDYLTKPFSVAELLARLRALLRRSRAAKESQTSADDTLAFGELLIDLRRRKVNVKEAAIDLTASEFDLLLFLAQNPGRPFTREDLLENVWECSQMVTEHSVNTMIRRIRLKIEPDPSNPTYILTARGVGYRFVEPSELA